MMYVLHRVLLFHLLTCLGPHALGSDIINGKNAPQKSVLYMASLQNDRGQHVCGGFLISKDLVLTAAHCDNANPTSVVLGTHNLRQVDETMRYTVKRCKHPSYEKPASGNDIMLLKLSKNARMDNTVQKIKISKTANKIEDNTNCTVAGWGLNNSGAKTDVLQVVDVPYVNLELCKRTWLGRNVKLPNTVICAGGYGTNKGFCKGDSGGPLVCGGMAVGVVSFNWRNNCDYPNVPNVYTDISKYLPWIEKIRKQKNC